MTQGLAGRLDGLVRGEHDHLDGRVDILEVLEDVDPAHPAS